MGDHICAESKINQDRITGAITPVILSGGVGTRLWPLSRHLRPKQFLSIHGDSSMFAQTLERVNGDPFSAPLVVCNDAHRFLVAEELRHASINPADIILEPAARNTAPAIAVAALRLMEHNSDAIMLVLPSDHVIENIAAFRSNIAAAAELVADGHLVTFGVSPSHPETGYGYIKQGEALCGKGWKVARFVEKPDEKTAKDYLLKGGYFWNAGIFVFSAKMFLEELHRYHPEIVSAARQALHNGQSDLDFFRLDQTAFETAPAISVDYAVMEKTEHAAMVPLSTGWNDIGSWASLWAIGDADADGNVTEGNTIILDASDNYIRSEKPLIAALGVSGLIIVATDDTVLVLPKDRAQEVKGVVAALDASGHEEAVSHTRVYRPWGHYQNLEGGNGFLVKRIVVNPGAKLSLQYHYKRAEHWIVVAGAARVTNGDEVFDLGPNQSTYIPQGARHRLENPGEQPLHLIEVQSGDYIGEDDIVRLEDTYGRN
jgi:mannose-1-phosphate guanylyltransferase/mannose-6-phosphate isomerase